MASPKISDVSVGLTLSLGDHDNTTPEILLKAGYLGLKRKMVFKMTLKEWSRVVDRFKRYLVCTKPTKFAVNSDLSCELGTARQMVLERKNGRQLVIPEKTFSDLTVVSRVTRSFKRGRYQVYGCSPAKPCLEVKDWSLLKSGQTWHNTPEECVSAAKNEGWDQPDCYSTEVRVEGVYAENQLVFHEDLVDETEHATPHVPCPMCSKPMLVNDDHYCPAENVRTLVVQILGDMINTEISKSVTGRCEGCLNGRGGQLEHTCLGIDYWFDEINFVDLYFESCFLELNKDRFLQIARFVPEIREQSEELFLHATMYWKSQILECVHKLTK
ncbi:hypothetical protein SNE40_012916 [Patella caerulea]|uniref:Uncharacterized protein n=1 Tax=Patella caerulea TaxID=87958 RepID=A0AAN8J3U1_PATCE